jgi:ribonuclease HI
MPGTAQGHSAKRMSMTSQRQNQPQEIQIVLKGQRDTWQYFVSDHKGINEFSGKTSEPMEPTQATLLALVMALEALPVTPSPIMIVCNYHYIIGLRRWLDKWATNSWRTSEGQPIQNLELVQRLYPLLQKHSQIRWQLASINPKRTPQLSKEHARRLRQEIHAERIDAKYSTVAPQLNPSPATNKFTPKTLIRRKAGNEEVV